MKRILVVDDEPQMREEIKKVFRSSHYVLTAESGQEALSVLANDSADLVLLDIVMPETDGMKFLQELRILYPDLPVIMVSSVTATRTMAEAIRLGAVDFISKPFDGADLKIIAERALAYTSVRRQMEGNRREQAEENRLNTMIGESLSFQHLLHKSLKQASHTEPILITGERGSGKKLLARHIHTISPRSTQPLISFRSSALPSHLIEVELFGQASAQPSQAPDLETLGRLDLASSGSLVIEDAYLLSREVQLQLVQVIRENVFTRPGSDNEIKTDARLIFIESGHTAESERESYIEELRALLEIHKLAIPALRARQEDIPLLAYYFLNQFRKKLNVEMSDIDSRAMEYLRDYAWPGNVTELRNIIERVALIHGQHKCLQMNFLPSEIRSETMGVSDDGEIEGSLEELVNTFQRKLITKALTKAKGKQVGAARILKTTPRILNHRIKQLNIKTVAK